MGMNIPAVPIILSNFVKTLGLGKMCSIDSVYSFMLFYL